MLNVLSHELADYRILSPDQYIHCFKTVSQYLLCLLRRKKCKNWPNNVVKELVVGVIVVKHLLDILHNHTDCVETIGDKGLICAFEVIRKVVEKVAPNVDSATHDYSRHYALDCLSDHRRGVLLKRTLQ